MTYSKNDASNDAFGALSFDYLTTPTVGTVVSLAHSSEGRFYSTRLTITVQGAVLLPPHNTGIVLQHVIPARRPLTGAMRRL